MLGWGCPRGSIAWHTTPVRSGDRHAAPVAAALYGRALDGRIARCRARPLRVALPDHRSERHRAADAPPLPEVGAGGEPARVTRRRGVSSAPPTVPPGLGCVGPYGVGGGTRPSPRVQSRSCQGWQGLSRQGGGVTSAEGGASPTPNETVDKG